MRSCGVESNGQIQVINKFIYHTMNENKPSEEDDASNKMNKTMARVLFDHESRHV